MEDEIVKEIHETRQQIFDECGGDIERYIEHLKVSEANNKHRFVTFEEVQQRARTAKAEI